MAIVVRADAATYLTGLLMGWLATGDGTPGRRALLPPPPPAAAAAPTASAPPSPRLVAATATAAGGAGPPAVAAAASAVATAPPSTGAVAAHRAFRLRFAVLFAALVSLAAVVTLSVTQLLVPLFVDGGAAARAAVVFALHPLLNALLAEAVWWITARLEEAVGLAPRTLHVPWTVLVTTLRTSLRLLLFSANNLSAQLLAILVCAVVLGVVRWGWWL